MDTTTHECGACEGHGEFASGRSCPRCDGKGVQLCTICRSRPGTQPLEQDDTEYFVCSECADILRADTCGVCLEPGAIPVAMVSGKPACTNCWVASARFDTMPPSPVPSTIPCEPANDFGDEEPDSLLDALQWSAIVVEAAKDAEVEPAEAMRTVRRAAARR